jgi:effector-binding domain-containing protein
MQLLGDIRMELEIKIKEISEQSTLAIRDTTRVESIPDKIGKIYSEIMAFMGKKRIAPAGAPFAYWHNMNAESISKGVFDMECGFPVGAPFKGEGNIIASKLPGGKVVTAMHIGPYDTLVKTYEFIQIWIKENGLQVAEDMWEIYLTDPCKEPDSSKWMTEICWPLK